MKKALKTYQLKIDPKNKSLVSAIAMVMEPAIESDFLKFDKEYQEQEFAANDEQMELLGAAMIPDQLIYRKDKKTGEEFNVYFTSDTIRQIAQEYFNHGYQSNMNLNHTATPAKSYIFQSFIVDSSKGITAPKGIDCPDGTWIIGVKVTDKAVWNDIKLGKVKGFSVEGLFEMLSTDFSNENDTNDEAELLDLLARINKIIANKK